MFVGKGLKKLFVSSDMAKKSRVGQVGAFFTSPQMLPQLPKSTCNSIHISFFNTTLFKYQKFTLKLARFNNFIHVPSILKLSFFNASLALHSKRERFQTVTNSHKLFVLDVKNITQILYEVCFSSTLFPSCEGIREK